MHTLIFVLFPCFLFAQVEISNPEYDQGYMDDLEAYNIGCIKEREPYKLNKWNIYGMVPGALKTLTNLPNFYGAQFVNTGLDITVMVHQGKEDILYTKESADNYGRTIIMVFYPDQQTYKENHRPSQNPFVNKMAYVRGNILSTVGYYNEWEYRYIKD